ncbi:14285_t:CDS:2, partial [Entrophospora sp. SA101]
PDILMFQIQSVQTEQECLEPLISEFIQKTPFTKESEQKYKEIFYEMNDDGFNNMFTCYEKGLKRLNDLLYQEVYKKIPRSTIGRQSKDVAFVKVKEHNKLIKEINKGKSNEEIEVGDNLPTLVSDITVAPIDEVETSSLKYKRHKKTNEELEILQELFDHPTESI